MGRKKIKKWFRKKAFELHPDKGGNAEKFGELVAEYNKKLKSSIDLPENPTVPELVRLLDDYFAPYFHMKGTMLTIEIRLREILEQLKEEYLLSQDKE